MNPAFFLRRPSALAASAGSSLMDWDMPDLKRERGADELHRRQGISYLVSQLPPSPQTLNQPSSSSSSAGSGPEISPMDMASLVAAGGPSGTNSKQIPLLCTVCPETPHFSDVSHLLTHIASKGHLHHETQTKLKAHQDISASVTLQQYEVWYRENGIEALLVDRMKAKQLKEAARNKRSRGASVTASLKQAKKKTKRTTNAHMKSDNEAFTPEFPIFPGFFASDNENEAPDDFFAPGDMMALKGQVWPGMGKMDLANEDMKRTRNQRKPKSVIEKMRRTSEGIEPTQVVMTPEFEVERIKDVYDSSSPIPGQEDATPQKKVSKPRRKRPEPLAEISVNIPRGNRRSARGNPAPEKISKTGLGYNSRTSSSEITPTLGHFKRNFDVFRDEDAIPVFEDRQLLGSSHRETKFDLHGLTGLRQLNPISHSNIVSPTPSSRDIPDRTYSSRDIGRGRMQSQSYLGINNHIAPGSINTDMSYALHDTSLYGNSARMSLSTGNQFNPMDQFQLSANHHLPHRFEDFSHVNSSDSMSGSATNQFLNLSGSNPLFSHDRLFLGTCGQSNQSSSFPSIGFTPINRHQESSHQIHHNQDRQNGSCGVKLEPQFCEILDGPNADDTNKDSNFGVNGIWEPQMPENDIGIPEELQHDGIEI